MRLKLIQLILLFVFHLHFQSYAQGSIWGMTANGGSKRAGTIFEYNIATGVMEQRVSFNGTTAGFGPIGALCLAGNNKLYGVTERKGTYDKGVLFEFDISARRYTKKLDFDGPNGSQPKAGMTLAPNGKLYGTTASGGANGRGVLYEFDPQTDTYTVKVNFTVTNGRHPGSALTLGSNGKLYGTTFMGGATDSGVIFEYNPATDVYTKLHDFDSGAAWAGVIEGQDGKLYGTMPTGGTGNHGHIYSFDLTTRAYQHVHDFTGYPNGATPFGGRLCKLNNGMLYGLTDSGDQGNAGPGIIYSFDPASARFSKAYTFKYDQTMTGSVIDMFSGLVQVNDVKLYGMTQYGGYFGYGTFFEYDIDKKQYTLLHFFSGGIGASPASCALILIPSREQRIIFGAIASKNFNSAPFTLNARATTGLPVSYTSSNPAVATISGNMVTITGTGTTTITASQPGNADYDAAPDVAQTLVVKKVDQQIYFGELPKKYYGDASFTLTATASSGLPVSFSSSDESVATISGNVVTIHESGAAVITASQAGNENYNAAYDWMETLFVERLQQSITFNDIELKFYNDLPFTLAATATSGLPVSYRSTDESVARIEGNTVYITGTGWTQIFAFQDGDRNHDYAQPVFQELVVLKAYQHIFFDALLPKSYGDKPFDLTATATSGLPVSYYSDNPAVATITGNTVTIHGPGTALIFAIQQGNNNFEHASAPSRKLTVSKGDQRITFDPLPDKISGDPPVTLAATATSGQPVTYSSSNPAVATVSGNKLFIVGPGTAVITAAQPGNQYYNAAISVQQTLTVRSLKTEQIITFPAVPAKTMSDPSFTLGAKANSGLPISYSTSNPAIMTISGNVVTLKSAGTAIITATQSGNISYYPATPVQQTLTIGKVPQKISFGGLPQNISLGSRALVLGASSSSGLPVTYSSSDPAIASANANVLTIVGPGWVRITVTQAGNAIYQEAEPVWRDLYVNKSLQTIAFENLPQKLKGDDPFLLNAAASSGLPVYYTSSNTNVAIIDHDLVRILNPGTAIITASQPGNDVFEPATPVKQTLIVGTITGIDETPQASATGIFPNPASSMITISLNDFQTDQPLQLIFCNNQGGIVRKLEAQPGRDISVDITSLVNGVYWISVTQGKNIRHMRFVKLQ